LSAGSVRAKIPAGAPRFNPPAIARLEREIRRGKTIAGAPALACERTAWFVRDPAT